MSSRAMRKKRGSSRRSDLDVSTPRGSGRKAVQKPRYVLDAEEEEGEEEETARGTTSESSRAASPTSAVKRGRGRGRKRGSLAGSGTSTPVNTTRGSRASSVSSSTVKKSRRKRGERTPFAPPSGNRRGGRGGGSRGGGKTGGRGYNPSLVNYKDSEYHYGSDFEDHEDGGGLGPDSGAESSDSEFSDLESRLSDDMKPESDVELEPSLLGDAAAALVAPLPFWLQEEASLCGAIPPLQLPESSADLVIENKTLLLEAVTIYEVLRQFYSIIRLSPFRLEDFCVVLQNEEEQSGLLSEIHIALLKTLLREEEQQQVQFGPIDQKESINVMLYVVDWVTWPENLRFYLSADPTAPGHPEALAVLTTTEYPFTSVENRLRVLRTLTDAVLSTAALRDVLQNEGQLPLEDHCRVCHRLGDMVSPFMFIYVVGIFTFLQMSDSPNSF
jgi:nucleosome-remodeling factor subunit BPTF